MRSILDNILTFSPQNISGVGLLACGLIWLGVWAVVIADILGSPKSWLWRLSWLVVVSVPLLGGILYSLRCLLTADWAATFFWRRPPVPYAGSKKSGSRSVDALK